MNLLWFPLLHRVVRNGEVTWEVTTTGEGMSYYILIIRILEKRTRRLTKQSVKHCGEWTAWDGKKARRIDWYSDDYVLRRERENVLGTRLNVKHLSMRQLKCSGKQRGLMRSRQYKKMTIWAHIRNNRSATLHFVWFSEYWISDKPVKKVSQNDLPSICYVPRMSCRVSSQPTLRLRSLRTPCHSGMELYIYILIICIFLPWIQKHTNLTL